MQMKLRFLFKIDESLKTKEIFNISYRCSGLECKKKHHKEDNFCDECGSKVEEIRKDLPSEYPNVHEFCENALNGEEIVTSSPENDLIPDNVWLYNYKLPKNMEKYVPNGHGYFFNVTDIDIDEGIEEFKKIPEVMKVISNFEAIYGSGMITIFYGLIESY